MKRYELSNSLGCYNFRVIWLELAVLVTRGRLVTLVLEDHEIWVQDDGVEDVRNCRYGDGNDDRPIRAWDRPVKGKHGQSHRDNGTNGQGAAYQCDSEADKNLWHFHEEVGSLDFLFRGTPSNIVREHVCEDGLGQMDGQTTKKYEAADGSSE